MTPCGIRQIKKPGQGTDFDLAPLLSSKTRQNFNTAKYGRNGANSKTEAGFGPEKLNKMLPTR